MASPETADLPRIPPSSTHSSEISQSSSPFKFKPNDAQYRVNHLRRANIFIDVCDDILISDLWSRVKNIMDGIENDTHLDQTSEKLWTKSKELAKKPSGETEWMDILHLVIDELKDQTLDIARNRDWREDLNPPVQNPQPTVPRKRSQPNRASSIRSHTQSYFPKFWLETPRPDICIGLLDNSLTADLEPTKGRSAARSFLADLQDTAELISDPHVTPVGLRFPFLIVEAKAGATGGNLYQAQNQAAVGGSAALQILRNLWNLNDTQDAAQQVFSVTTEGPIHELWLHFQRPDEGDFYMSCIGTWRTTLKRDCQDFVYRLQAILKWGNSDYRSAILRVLEAI